MQGIAGRVCLLLVALGAGLSAHAQIAGPWQPPANATTLPLWSGTPPGTSGVVAGPEVDKSTSSDPLVAGRKLIRLGNIATPTLTLYQPMTQRTGAAVLVFPGGGYSILAIDLEGTEVCDWLTHAGIACILVKYRVPDTGPYPKSSAALDDAQRAMGVVRQHAAEWQIDPHKVGVLGFSAGGHLAAALSTHFGERLYSPMDAADALSCRPDFAVVIYPGYLADAAHGFLANADIAVTSETPPTFLAQAEDDPVHVENALVYFSQLKAAKVPAELHIFAEGGHGYGLRHTALPVTDWPALVERWLRTVGIVTTGK